MSKIAETLASLRRPRLLITAARHGMAEYNRARDLARALGRTSLPSPDQALPELIAAEAELERTRLARRAEYSVARHVEILTALLGELRLAVGDSGGAPA
ncbi:hypothetical protein SAMN05216257_10654 [Meinhardsimonia xiamenensis]|jgi:hypothetical protein|uniref:Uncharacterized protein n=1 Tax=Meinhardsimonia xiamenensis TaxID=990712 RepID=A0A1G9G154_9RHOB|nr:DUF6477 family protein [Meinhardsimonia xiamenensis]PRX32722.1 hypothetical protein LV81_02484 [Meinhardsimonia xiamenensis]SDK94398.1 hypothetical protein SAMN05216257_10654 [Meinhardsimonia xiamenensis]